MRQIILYACSFSIALILVVIIFFFNKCTPGSIEQPTDVFGYSCVVHDFRITAVPDHPSIGLGYSDCMKVYAKVFSDTDCEDIADSLRVEAAGTIPPGVDIIPCSGRMHNNEGSCTVEINVSDSAVPGTYSFELFGTAYLRGDRTSVDTDPVMITVTADPNPYFEVSLSNTYFEKKRGESVSPGITFERKQGFNQPIYMTLENEEGIIGNGSGLIDTSFNPNPAMENSSTLTMNIGSAIPEGYYHFTLKCTGGEITKTVNFIMYVIESSASDFTLSTARTGITLEQGKSDTLSVFIERINAYDDTVSLWLSGYPPLPAGVSASFSPNPVPASASSSLLTIDAAYYTVAGEYIMEIMANYLPEIQRSIPVTLHIIPSTATFSLSVSEDTVFVEKGSSAQVAVTIDRLGEYNLQINLSTMELIGGYIDASFNPNVLYNPQTSSVLTVTPRNTTAPGNTYGILVCGEHFSGTQICDTLYITITSPVVGTWSSVNSPTSRNLRALSFINENKGWVIGDFGEIWKYNNGSWENQTVAGARNFDVHFTDEMTGTIVGDVQRIIRTFDGGQTWIDTLKPDQPISDYLYGVYFTDASNGWVVGGSSLIFHTTNGGDTWVKQTPQVDGRFRKVYFTTSTNGVIVGQASTNEPLILYTTNSGQDWIKSNYTSTLSSGNLSGVDFITNNVGFCGGGTQIYFTQDGGISWQEQFSPVGSNIYGIACGDVNNIWAVGTATLLRTTDGGSLWEREFQTNNFLLDAVFFNSTIGYAVGMNGVIMKRE